MGKTITTAGIEPMLARTMSDENLSLPCFVQPKLDGIRCLWDGRTAWTRSGRPHAPHIQRLASHWPAIHGVLDGELAMDPGTPFETIQSAVSRENERSGHLEFRIFDTISSSPFRDRYDSIRHIVIETVLIRSASELESALDRFLEAGHEGLIARNPASPYQPGYSDGLLKYKRFEDAEFRVVDILEAEGKDAGTAVMVCETATGLTFGVKPAGSRQIRMRILAERHDWIGKSYTVRFQGWTRNGIPRFPTGVAERTDIRWVMALQV
jgi:DNA ligase-1